mmetsp:Transcript_11896/g.16909  ORF Transcript_11896/g.16909 Transcript_11896/m.16909 type:complete len:118 (+) Transcript_11896:94-447(+)
MSIYIQSRGGVLGANSMQGHNVIFDRENGRVGFSQSSCRSSSTMPSTSFSSSSSSSGISFISPTMMTTNNINNNTKTSLNHNHNHHNHNHNHNTNILLCREPKRISWRSNPPQWAMV